MPFTIHDSQFTRSSPLKRKITARLLRSLAHPVHLSGYAAPGVRLPYPAWWHVSRNIQIHGWFFPRSSGLRAGQFLLRAGRTSEIRPNQWIAVVQECSWPWIVSGMSVRSLCLTDLVPQVNFFRTCCPVTGKSSAVEHTLFKHVNFKT